ncbi:UNVERIFIED_CONTAM: Glutamate receptor 2.7 [Sesamum radiatum]|uniref:Glutamate receptor 2.7 n=1 Tax=Sesamum radiatum TaxID=300843 RepID=A0AAW2URC5_SESRA
MRFEADGVNLRRKVSRPSNGDESIVNIGVIVDMGSWTGQLTMNHLHLFVYVPVVSASAPSPSPAAVTFMSRFLVTTLDLLENLEVEAIIISDISDEELFLARLADEVNVPLLSFSSISSLNEHPYFIQVAEDESNEFRAIAAFIDAFKWRSFVFLYEDTVDARQVQTYIYNISRENHLDIAYQTALSLRNTDDEIINELHKLKMTKSSIILVHLSPSLASQVFANAKMLGMMGEGYAWVVTSKTMNFLDSWDSSDYESMLGIVGFKSYISVSSKSQDLALRWRREFHQIESNLEIRDLNVVGLRAYDTAWVLAEAIERAGILLSPNRLPYKISYEYIPFYNQNGSYSDLIYQVYLQTYDAAVGDITILADRFAYVDFTVPYTDVGTGVILKLDDKDPWFFLRPLSADLWIMSACSFVLTGFIVWLIEHRINEEFQGPPAQQIGTLLWFAASTLVYAHRERLRSNASRFVVSMWLFVVLILTSSYIANLSSLLTVAQIKSAKEGYIGYTTHSLVRGFVVKNNLNFNDSRLKPFRSQREYDEALRKGSKKGGVDAIIEEIPYIKILIENYPTQYTMIEFSWSTGGFGFAFTKGSPLAQDISREISALREEGTLLEIEKKWFKSQSSLLRKESELPRLNTLSVANFVGLFLMSWISISIAVLIFAIFILEEKLSINLHIFRLLAGGKLISILRYLYPGMGNTIDGVVDR